MRALRCILFLLLFAAPVAAQSRDTAKPYDLTYPLYTYVDVASKAHFDGWSGDCNSGRIPLSIQLWRMDLVTLEGVKVETTQTTGPRPDAAAWLAATCHRPFDVNVGWSLVPVEPEPAGEFRYIVYVTDMPTSWACKPMPVGFPNSGQLLCDYVVNTVTRTLQ